MNQVWRLHLITDAAVENADVGQYCLDHHIAAMGWSLVHKTSDSDRKSIGADFSKFEKLADLEYQNKYESVKRFYHDLKENDLIWTRVHGQYYFARVKSESKWEFKADELSVKMDISNQISNIDWYPVSECADESSVPGAIATAFIKGSTFQRINKAGVLEYSQLLYNHIAQEGFKYEVTKLRADEKSFFNLLQPSDLEDILCMWLYQKKGYICIPSTNKIATPLYECVLLDPENPGKTIYIQVKKGNVDINAAEYKKLSGEIYLLTTEGKITNNNPVDLAIHIVDPTEIFQFCMDARNQNVLPEKIRTWVGFLGSKKGIMIDTNKTFSEADEIEMLMENKIAAYGAAKSYINRFHKDDYALFYSKGKGIIAVGRIREDSALAHGDEELYHNVEMLVPAQYDFRSKPMQALSPSEIKALVNHGFYFASTMKVPFLDEFEVQKIRTALQKKYEEQFKKTDVQKG